MDNPNPQRTNAARKYNYAALFLAAALCWIGLPYVWLHVQFYLHSEVQVGRVVRITYGRYHADAEFKASNGATYRLPISSLQPFEKDDPVEIRYDPREPDKSGTLNDWLNMWGLTAFYFLFLYAFIYCGVTGKKIHQKGLEE